MASLTKPNSTGQATGEGATASSTSGTGDSTADMEELRRLQLAHEGMRLLLSSEVKQAEQLFRSSRYLGPELNAGYSFVQFVRSLMTFEEDSMDTAYKCLEGTEKFCDTSKKFSELFQSNSQVPKLTPHQRLYRKSIIADCLLFEAVLVFIRQSLTSYVKGGYLIRKAWKMYEKIYAETELLCQQPSPISKPGAMSPTDTHVGTSLYDNKEDFVVPEVGEEEEGEEGEREEEGEEGEDGVGGGEEEEKFRQSLFVLGDTFAMQLGFGVVDGEKEEKGEEEEGKEGKGEEEGKRERKEEEDRDKASTSKLQNSCESASLSFSNSQSDQSSGSHDSPTTGRKRTDQSKGGQARGKNSRRALSLPYTGGLQVRGANGTTRTQNQVGISRSASTNNQLSGRHSIAGGEDMTDGGRMSRRKKRPLSGYDIQEAPEISLISDLQHQDDRLRGAVYFGYGMMNIVLSLIPPKLMKLANLFGFQGNRRLGLQALEFASNSQDMKAPLARIALLWYHTIVRPFFALDGEKEDAGADEAERLLKEAESLYPNSALFLYFQGKVMYLRCQLDEALSVYTSATILARDQREIEHIALYEKGWIHFLQLDYAQALPCYTRLKNETRWSACYYAYLSAAMTGVMGDMKQSRELFLQTARLVKRKNNNLEKFCARRGQLYKKGVTFLMPLEARLMIVEVIYLWRALPFCSEDTKLRLMEMLDMALPPDATPFHKAMRAWLRGGVLNSLKRQREAEKSLREAIQYETDIKQDKHILSFSLYELAMIHVDKTEYAKARTLLNFAKDAYAGYEFEARLNFKVHSALNSLR